MSAQVRTTVVLLFAAWFVDYADRIAIAVILPTIGDEFDLDRGQQGLVVSVFFVAYAACQIPGGMLADRFGDGTRRPAPGRHGRAAGAGGDRTAVRLHPERHGRRRP
ncbi:hypothetical protein SHO565_16630 [Streptomyces sp. HO565]